MFQSLFWAVGEGGGVEGQSGQKRSKELTSISPTRAISSVGFFPERLSHVALKTSLSGFVYAPPPNLHMITERLRFFCPTRTAQKHHCEAGGGVGPQVASAVRADVSRDILEPFLPTVIKIRACLFPSPCVCG